MSTTPHSPQGPLVSELSDDPDMLEPIEMFVDELPAKVQAIEQAVDANDIATLSRLAHQLKGSAGGYGFPWITDAARELEQSSKAAADVATLKTHLASLAELCYRSAASAEN